MHPLSEVKVDRGWSWVICIGRYYTRPNSYPLCNTRVHARYTGTTVDGSSMIWYGQKIKLTCDIYGGPNPPLYKTFAPRFYNLLHDFTICSTILQFEILLYDFTICSTILQFSPRFYNFLHDFIIFSTILQFAPRFYNFLHDFTIFSTILQFAPRFYNFLHDFTIFSTIL